MQLLARTGATQSPTRSVLEASLPRPLRSCQKTSLACPKGGLSLREHYASSAEIDLRIKTTQRKGPVVRAFDQCCIRFMDRGVECLEPEHDSHREEIHVALAAGAVVA